MDYREMAGDFLRLRAEHIKSAVGRESERNSHGELLALSLLYSRDEGVYPRTLSRELGVSAARVAAMLGDMEEKGWIHREPDPGDSRHILVSLTPLGREVALARRQGAVEALAGIFQRLGPEDTGELIRILKRLNEICT